MDYRITPEVLTFYAGQFAFDGMVQCAVVEILDDDVCSHNLGIAIDVCSCIL